MEKPIHPLIELSNRKLKRAYLHEVEKIAEKIDDITLQFELAVFNAPNELTYSDLYQYFLKRWYSLIDEIKRVYKPKYSLIDTYYFARKYKSVV
jgi:hypothetical protein